MTDRERYPLHPELHQQRDRRLAAEFAALMLGSQLSDGPPTPGTPLARMQAVWAAFEAGTIDAAERYRQVGEVLKDALAEAEAAEFPGS